MVCILALLIYLNMSSLFRSEYAQVPAVISPLGLCFIDVFNDLNETSYLTMYQTNLCQIFSIGRCMGGPWRRSI